MEYKHTTKLVTFRFNSTDRQPIGACSTDGLIFVRRGFRNLGHGTSLVVDTVMEDEIRVHPDTLRFWQGCDFQVVRYEAGSFVMRKGVSL